MSENNNTEKITENIENPNTENTSNEFNGKIILKYLLKNKLYVIIATLLAAIGSVIYVLTLPNWYLSVANAVPPKSAGNALESMLGGFASSLKELGLSKLTGGKGGGDQYSFLVILESRTLADSMIAKYDLAKSYFPDEDLSKIKPSDVREMFYENLTIEYLDDGNYNIGIMDKDSTRVAAMAMDYINMANALAQRIYKEETGVNKAYLESRVSGIDSLLRETSKELAAYSSKTGIINPEGQGKAFVEAVATLKYELYSQEVLLESMKSKLGENDFNTKSQEKTIKVLRDKLREIENKPGFAGNFTMSDAGEKGINFLSKTAEFEALTKLKLFMQPMLEEAKVNENRNLVTLTIVDYPITPDKKEKPKRSLIVAGITLGAMLLSILVLLGVFSLKRLKKELNSIE